MGDVAGSRLAASIQPLPVRNLVPCLELWDFHDGTAQHIESLPLWTPCCFFCAHRSQCAWKISKYTDFSWERKALDLVHNHPQEHWVSEGSADGLLFWFPNNGQLAHKWCSLGAELYQWAIYLPCDLKNEGENELRQAKRSMVWEVDFSICIRLWFLQEAAMLS